MNTELSITITPPDGMEIDKEKSTFEKIVFKPKQVVQPYNKPKWEDIGLVKGYYVNDISKLWPYSANAMESNRNTFPTKEEAEACIALSQLLQWRDKYNEGWKPNLQNVNDLKFVIYSACGFIKSTSASNKFPAILSFKSPEIRDKFGKDFLELLEIAKPLLG